MAKAICEFDGKTLLYQNLTEILSKEKVVQIPPLKAVSVDSKTVLNDLPWNHPWLKEAALVVKPDQLIKRRGQLGLVALDKSFQEVQLWLTENMDKEITINSAVGKLNKFIIEQYLPHEDEEEYYVCIYATRSGNRVLFHPEGGVSVGDVDAKAHMIDVDVEDYLSLQQALLLLSSVPPNKQKILAEYLVLLYKAYVDLFFTYLEINPLVVKGNEVHMLDLAAKLDTTAEYICKKQWGGIAFPSPFGRDAFPEEAYIADLDAKSGASLKLTVLNPNGRIWTMVAGGGASVIYSDTICDLGGGNELANYGEYSGAPSEHQTFEYAKTILGLMTKGSPRDEGKVLIIGGGIANFTNVAATFKGIVKALTEFKHKLSEHKVTIFVRRGGPNYQEGLKVMRETGSTLSLPIHVFGPETHMTAIVGMALGRRSIPRQLSTQPSRNGIFQMPSTPGTSSSSLSEMATERESSPQLSYQLIINQWTEDQDKSLSPPQPLFTEDSTAIIWGMQPKAVQSMMDFDYLCSREKPSVVAMVYPFSGNHKQRFYWGAKEMLLPVYKNMSEATSDHPQASVLVNFASLRSAFESTMESLRYPQFRSIAIIAEGIPENLTKKLIKAAASKGVTIIGPATVGGVKPGCFKIGNTGGMMDNIIASKLYRPGSVAYVSRSGGMSNELNNIVSSTTDGVYEGVAIGGDRYPGSTFMDHVLRYHDDPNVKMIVVLGEVGGIEEYEICENLKTGRLFKPVVAWCIGTCSKMFSSEVQFGHAGACANSERETADAKNKALLKAGAFVPDSFDTLGVAIREVYEQLVAAGLVVPKPEKEPPPLPMDYSWAQELGLIRKPAAFISSICDERGEELLYAGMPISDVFKENIGIGGVLSLLWFQRRLPEYACKFLEICLMVTADHGPAVSGAHNTIVTTRAGKDLVSSLTSGLLTIGDRFGGALDGSASQFSHAYDSGMIPMEFVNEMRKQNKLILGIGHRVKSLNNPDMRVNIIKDYVKMNFPASPVLDYALEVEKITTAKKPNLILNVDGVIATSFVDLLRHCGAFTREEAHEYLEIGSLNGLFVLGRTVGFIGHYLDQKRLRQGLYRHPWDDISYLTPDTASN
jgi:ATP citrate (pro-S)-lyase